MKCVVTGSSGYIGGFLVARLISLGHEVVGLDCVSSKSPVQGAEYVQKDISCSDGLSEVLHDAEWVFHCAAIVKDFGSKDQFFSINVEGTKNVAGACGPSLRRFVFLGHIPYEKKRKGNLYRETKDLALEWLLDRCRSDGFPLVVLRPGNVFGPGKSMWVLRPFSSIKNGRITLIDGGRGIFLHTFVENLVDALLLAASVEGVEGEVFDITDGDNQTSWGKYINDLASLLGKSVSLSMPAFVARGVGRLSVWLAKFSGKEPVVSPTAVEIFANKQKISIAHASKVLGYSPQVSYDEAFEKISLSLEKMGLLN